MGQKRRKVIVNTLSENSNHTAPFLRYGLLKSDKMKENYKYSFWVGLGLEASCHTYYIFEGKEELSVSYTGGYSVDFRNTGEAIFLITISQSNIELFSSEYVFTEKMIQLYQEVDDFILEFTKGLIDFSCCQEMSSLLKFMLHDSLVIAYSGLDCDIFDSDKDCIKYEFSSTQVNITCFRDRLQVATDSDTSAYYNISWYKYYHSPYAMYEDILILIDKFGLRNIRFQADL